MAGLRCFECSDQIFAKNVNYVYSNALKSPESLGQVCHDSDWRATFYILNEAESVVATAEHFLWKPEPSWGLHPGVRLPWFLGHCISAWICYNSEQPLSFCTSSSGHYRQISRDPRWLLLGVLSHFWHPKGQLIPFCLSCL